MSETNGQVQSVLDRLVANGPEVGLQVAAYLDGRLVVDAWAGLADEESKRPMGADTLITVNSTCKGYTATCMHILAEQGKIDYDDPICKYWPEFAAHGKGGATIRHALAHSAGVPQTPPGFTTDWLADWDRMCAAIAEMEPTFEPGSMTAYHYQTYGFIAGEIIRRADGRPIGEFLQQELCKPLQLDMYLGVPEDVMPRVATLKGWTAADFNRPDIRRAAIPGSGGITNARSLARHYAMLAQGGELDGIRILSPERIRVATALQSNVVDALYK